RQKKTFLDRSSSKQERSDPSTRPPRTFQRRLTGMATFYYQESLNCIPTTSNDMHFRDPVYVGHSAKLCWIMTGWSLRPESLRCSMRLPLATNTTRLESALGWKSKSFRP